jgi:hypothetical protein
LLDFALKEDIISSCSVMDDGELKGRKNNPIFFKFKRRL